MKQGRLTAEDLDELDRIQANYAASLESNDIAMWNGLNKDFHMRLYQYAGSPRMLNLVANLLTECDIHTRIQLLGIPGDRERAVAEHRALLVLCRARRDEEAADLLRRHIDHIRCGLLNLTRRHTQEDAGALG